MNAKQQYKLCYRLYRSHNRVDFLMQFLSGDYEPGVTDGNMDEEQYEQAERDLATISNQCKRLEIPFKFHQAAQRALADRYDDVLQWAAKNFERGIEDDEVTYCVICGGTGQDWDLTPCIECDGTGYSYGY